MLFNTAEMVEWLREERQTEERERREQADN